LLSALLARIIYEGVWLATPFQRTTALGYLTTSEILFVSHDASRTGAPMALLHFLRWFKKNANRPFSILLGAGGELVPEFETLADTWSVDNSPWRRDAVLTRGLFAAGLGKLASRAEAAGVQRFAARRSPALIYANSIASSRALEMLAPRAPILTHVHELNFHFRIMVSPGLPFLLSQTRQFIACSNAVSDNLILGHGVPKARVEVVHESIPVNETRAERSRGQIYQELQIPDEVNLVVAGGTTIWRKGPDLFIHLARAVLRHCSNAYFLWVGGGTPSELAQLEHDVRLAGLAQKVRFIGAVAKPADYLSAADVFILTSREDPYPLISLEAAALEKPIVCFEAAGGTPEFVEEDCGYVVPYLDITEMANRVVFLLNSPERRVSMGKAAREKVAQRHDISLAAPLINGIIERTVRSSGRVAAEQV
jgi:glycosyltransferase involved in cell wall biosynthesis